MTVAKFDKDGNKLATVIWVLSDGAYGPPVDAAETSMSPTRSAGWPAGCPNSSRTSCPTRHRP